MPASALPSSYHNVVDEPLLRSVAAEIQPAIPGAEVWLYSCGEAFGYGSRARGTERPDSDLDLLVNSHQEVLDQSQYRQHGMTTATWPR
jgi:predicted nucleotidyltransferase